VQASESMSADYRAVAAACAGTLARHRERFT